MQRGSHGNPFRDIPIVTPAVFGAGRGALAIGEGWIDQIRHEDRRTSHGEGCAAIAGPWLRLNLVERRKRSAEQV
jgi:hypothetical protein